MGLATQAGLLKGYEVNQDREKLMASALGRLSFVNSRHWIGFMQSILPQLRISKGALLPHLNKVERTMLTIFYYTLWGKGLVDLANRLASVEEAIFWALDAPLLILN